MTDPPSSSACRRLPRHVGIIMDGNGRWAEERGLSRIEGHREGAKSVRDITRASRRMGIEAVTLYAFSAQNWARPATEVRALMELLRDYLVDERDEIMDNGIQLNSIGEADRLPPMVRDPLRALMAESAGNTDMVLTLALSYGSREALVNVVKALSQSVRDGTLEPRAITKEMITAGLATSDLPPLDLLIRTSGEKRLSNFLLWEAAYAELYFCETMWPDFRQGDLRKAIEAYEQRERRFGLVSAQLSQTGHPNK